MSEKNKLPELTSTQAWCCSNGCGECRPVPDEFETMREEDVQGNLIRREIENIFVSHCCRKDLMLWDESTQDFIDGWTYITEQAMNEKACSEVVAPY
jgi:hypothetical protein